MRVSSPSFSRCTSCTQDCTSPNLLRRWQHEIQNFCLSELPPQRIESAPTTTPIESFARFFGKWQRFLSHHNLYPLYFSSFSISITSFNNEPTIQACRKEISVARGRRWCQQFGPPFQASSSSWRRKQETEDGALRALHHHHHCYFWIQTWNGCF